MKIYDLLRMSLNNLRRRKGRTALTVIGVVVGTCAIVVMISLGLAISAQNEEMLASWGDLTKIQIYNYGGDPSGKEVPKLDDEMITSLRSMEHVVAATPYYQPQNIGGNITAGKNDQYSQYLWNIYGLYPDALEPMGFQLASGKFLTSDMNLGKDKIPVLVGQNMGYQFEDTRRSQNSAKRRRYQGQTDSLGNPVPPFVDVEKDKMTLKLSYTDQNGKEESKEYQLVVVGVLVSDYNAGYFTDGGVVMRLSDVQMLEKAYEKLSGQKSNGSSGSVYVSGSSGSYSYTPGSNGYEEVYVKVDKVDNVAEVENQIKDIGYQTRSMTQIREEMQASVARSQMILGGLAAISLLVAALNIANTMTMAIYERTREIGVMKVLGCELGHIRAMFLVESGAIGFLGGAIGVLFSLLISFILNHLTLILALFGSSADLSGLLGSIGGGMGGMGGMGTGSISIVPFWLVLLALAFATLVGLLSGIMPAGRAVKISALEAIRHE